MNRFIEFTYETLDGKLITIHGEANSSTVKFSAYDHTTGESIDKNSIKPYDMDIIEDFIYNNSDEIDPLDAYDRYDD